MLHTKNTDQFILKHIDTCSPVELFNTYDYLHRTYGKFTCPNKLDLLRNALWYINRLLLKYSPEEGFGEICRNAGMPDTKENIEEGYVESMFFAALLEEYFENFERAAFFAKKALHMIHYFRPYLNQLSKETVWKENDTYNMALTLYERTKEHLADEVFYEYDLLAWEKKYYNPSAHANLNYKGLKLI